jgi:hypothetical protein
LGAIDVVNVKDFGAVGDGSSHPLSGTYGSLAAAQAVYPFVTDLAQQLDWAACKKASNTALGEDGSEHGSANAYLNKPIHIPAGIYMFGSDTWTIRNASGIQISGQGTTSTILRSNATVLAFDGLWYSSISGMQIESQTNTAVAALDLDGNVPGHAYATRSVQFVRLEDLIVVGGGSTYALAVCRQGGSGAQGSSMFYFNLGLQNASFACYYQNGYNALANVWVGGDIQNYTKHGIYLNAGSIQVYTVSFESTHGYEQIVNDGFDFNADSGGVFDGLILHGCRTESLRFVRTGSSQYVDVRACTQNAAFSTWSATSALPLNYIVEKQDADGFINMYRVTTAGTTGGTEPTWPTSGTVTDGSVVWTLTYYNAVEIYAGSIDLQSSSLQASAFYDAKDSKYNRVIEVTTVTYDLWHGNPLYAAIDGILVYPNLAGGDVIVHLGGAGGRPAVTGRQIVIKRANSDSHHVTITGVADGTVVLQGGTMDYATFMLMGGGAVGVGWYLIGRASASGAPGPVVQWAGA